MASGSQPIKLSAGDATIRRKALSPYPRAFAILLGVLFVGLFFVVTGAAEPSFLLGVFVLDVLSFSAFLIYRAGVIAKAERAKGLILWEERSFWLLNLAWAILIGLVVGITAVVSLIQAMELAVGIGVLPLAVLVMAYVERTTRNRKRSRS
jgi:hypothetical protein